MVNEAENDNDGVAEAALLETLSPAGKQEIGRRIHKRMLARGWRQADLARASDLSRNSISNYIKGNQAPSGTSLVALAKALKCKPADLVPDFKMPEDTRETLLEMKVMDGGLSHLIVNKIVTTEAAFEIMRILEADGAKIADRTGSSGSASNKSG